MQENATVQIGILAGAGLADKSSHVTLNVFWIRIMGDSSASYIHMVQHLIEKCLIFNMTKEECMEALSKHANIEPVITSTVWKELEKENKEFFEAYAQSKSNDDRMSEEETSKMIQKIISQPSESSKDHDPDE
ncbi:ANGIOTENSIN-CONVERTING ENZYME 2-RELATED [Salix koriyanagi]|uniref:ANGIOTENSIN-CONVERTING ENZYME 2-RELATED n=2 Tax=Salix TaxID=40685 RepID=A0A9Q1AIL9_9ROSI|nr:ANGIOTENSIN-CONVERTING ENZYME 2-RELATED [Salix koriyanagi]